MAMHLPRITWRMPLLGGALLVLMAAMWGGLLRLGWPDGDGGYGRVFVVFNTALQKPLGGSSS